MKNLIKRNFTQIPNDLINDNKISRDARFLFVYLCSKPDDWKFHTSVIEKDMGFSKDTRIKYMKELMNFGWITMEQKKTDKGAFGQMEIVLNPFPKISDAVKNPIPKKAVSEKVGVGEITTHNNKEINNNTNLFTNTDVVIVPIPESVLDYLNQNKKSNIPFKPTPANLKDITKRIKEKFKIEDFKNVIDFKVAEWSNDPKMKKYIRPETLFGDKFNSYLIEANEKPLTKTDGSGNFEKVTTTTNDLL